MPMGQPDQREHPDGHLSVLDEPGTAPAVAGMVLGIGPLDKRPLNGRVHLAVPRDGADPRRAHRAEARGARRGRSERGGVGLGVSHRRDTP
jgi:hypothetical protein